MGVFVPPSPPSDFIVSTATACLCWRALKLGGQADAAESKEESNHSNPAEPSRDTSFVPPKPKVPHGLKTLQLVLWNISCIASLGVALIFWGALVRTIQQLNRLGDVCGKGELVAPVKNNTSSMNSSMWKESNITCFVGHKLIVVVVMCFVSIVASAKRLHWKMRVVERSRVFIP